MRRLALSILAFALAGPAAASDGVLEINHACASQTGCFAGDVAGYPVTITGSGSYQLTGHLSSASGPAISITASPVSIELNGFTIESQSVPVIVGASIEVQLTNGLVRFSGEIGSAFLVDLQGSAAVLKNVRVAGETARQGIRLGSRCRIESSSVIAQIRVVELGSDCLVTDSTVVATLAQGAPAVSAGNSSTFERNRISINDGVGIRSGTNSHLSGNVVVSTMSFSPGVLGLSAGAFSVLRSNTANDLDSGIVCGDACVIEGNTTNKHEIHGIVCGRGCRMVDNTANENGVSRFAGGTAGLSCKGYCSVSGNTAIDNYGPALQDDVGGTSYSGNQFSNNNGGNANPQVSGGIDAGGNICGGDAVCP